MRLALKITAALFFIALTWVASTITISELGGEVVTLGRPEPDNTTKNIRVWIVDDQDKSYIEHGDEDSYWVQAAKQSRIISVERRGKKRSYLARADSRSHSLYHHLRREKYGYADILLETLSFGAMSEENCNGVPVVLTEPTS